MPLNFITILMAIIRKLSVWMAAMRQSERISLAYLKIMFIIDSLKFVFKGTSERSGETGSSGTQKCESGRFDNEKIIYT